MSSAPTIKSKYVFCRLSEGLDLWGLCEVVTLSDGKCEVARLFPHFHLLQEGNSFHQHLNTWLREQYKKGPASASLWNTWDLSGLQDPYTRWFQTLEDGRDYVAVLSL